MKKIIILLFILVSSLLVAEDFDIKEFSKMDKYGWKDKESQLKARERLQFEKELFQMYSINHQDISKNVFKSIAFPGWGHYSAESITKGHVLLSSGIVLLGSSIFYLDRTLYNYNNYKDATNIKDIRTYYNQANTDFFRTQLFFSSYVLVWLYSIFDSINATETYNARNWNKILENKKFKVSLKENGIEVRF